jgi:colanic acid biosynthesis glycosyl transferase WcaI
LRFLILTQYFAPEVGATQIRLSAMCKELVRAGHSVEVVTAMPHHPAGIISPEYRGRFYSWEFQGAVKVHRVWLYAVRGSGMARIAGYLSFMITSMFGLFKATRPDFVFVDSPPLFLGVTGWMASALWNCPLIFNVADLWPDSARDLGVIKSGLLLRAAYSLERWIYRRADYLTAVTDGVRDVLLNKKDVPKTKVLFLPNGVDTELIQPIDGDEQLKAKLGLSGKRVIIYAGNHGYAAAADQILHAAALLTQQRDLHFVFVGDGPEKARLQALAQELRLSSVSFLDPVPLAELPSLLALADIAVITLRRAGVTSGARPAKAFVMMAAGKPIVLAATGEAERLIRTAESGVVVPPHEPRKLAAALLKMLADPQAARRMGERGRQFVIGNFEWSVLVRSWLKQLQEKSNFGARETSSYEASVKSPAPL